MYQRASNQLLDVSSLSTDAPLDDQIIAGLDAHFDFFVANARTVIEACSTQLHSKVNNDSLHQQNSTAGWHSSEPSASTHSAHHLCPETSYATCASETWQVHST